ncbi:MAG: hypothetical protein H7144_04625 [Burkholderiales bacterium]|nr:hypothetical protein [Phycisphaerae bacterium]
MTKNSNNRLISSEADKLARLEFDRFIETHAMPTDLIARVSMACERMLGNAGWNYEFILYPEVEDSIVETSICIDDTRLPSGIRILQISIYQNTREINVCPASPLPWTLPS